MALAVFLLPVGRWLSLSVPSARVTAIIYLLALQILVLILWGQLASPYRAIGRAYRGVMWLNLQKLAMLAVTVAAVALKQSFMILALLQLGVALLSLASVWLDLKLKFNDVSVKPIRMEWSLAKEIIRPSLYFSLFVFNNFLIYQLPVLILNRFETPLAIIVFSVGRTLFSFVRQGLSVIQASIGPEITRLEGIKDWANLKRLYQSAESLTISAAVVVNTVIFTASPVLLQVWMKRTDIFVFKPMLFLMLIAAVICLKDFKFYYQSMTNRHEKMAIIMFVTYIAMTVLSFWSIKYKGLNGFLMTWLAVETIQLLVINKYNNDLFIDFFKMSLKPIVSTLSTLFALTVIFVLFKDRLTNQTPYMIIAQSLIIGAVIFIAAYRYIGLRECFKLLYKQLKHS
ncbi:hypothetical protein HY768_03205 [candidate division TA06 bacterium]|uniref:Polysaccharide biosynthesis protein C-terminal domain-containing protein n=1 Tax=candidate division TA06 bacterium TaxID=2250710 RepID=A0A933I8K5_UNCT6|nr:hypothetical protein [candidate division TA06 bacterium]